MIEKEKDFKLNLNLNEKENKNINISPLKLNSIYKKEDVKTVNLKSHRSLSSKRSTSINTNGKINSTSYQIGVINNSKAKGPKIYERSKKFQKNMQKSL